ncbi:MAG: proteasome assembly chaperone family protein [Methanomicrobiales archaeon]|nr:proteasome assembly chaperone family protein [Methanomicrobiales archaeon]
MIEDISIRYLDSFADKTLNAPILIEGLPGIGQVGKLVAEYMIQALGAEKIGEITSLYFPPQVILDEDGTARLSRNELFLCRTPAKDIIFLVGDHQSTSGEGHYILADFYCDVAKELGVRRIYTLGGFGVGHLVNEPRVLGAVNRPELREQLEAAGVMFQRPEPGGGIVGAAGLILALAVPREIDAVCLMGETSGYLVDPMAASSVLGILANLIEIPVDPTNLNDRAAEMEKAIENLVESEQHKDEELSYIG